MLVGTSFGAPWGKMLKIMTAFTVIILVVIPIIGLLTSPESIVPKINIVWFFSMVVMPLLILIVTSFFAIRGYIISKDHLLIKRFGWCSKLNLKELKSVEIDPLAMKRSIRTFGNGGLFSFCGKFWNKRLGFYGAYVTDPNLSVVLRFTNKVIVISPEKPDRFVDLLKQVRGI